MAVPNQNPESQHTGNGTTTVFAYGFLLLAAGDLQVYLNGVLQTLGVHYTVAGTGNPSGGAVTFGAAPAAGASVLLVRQVTQSRSTDYQYAGDFQAKTVNLDFDRIWMAVQDLAARLGSAIRYPRGENALNSILPRAALRARKAVVFDASGNATVSTDDYEDQAANAAASAAAAEAARDVVVPIAEQFGNVGALYDQMVDLRDDTSDLKGQAAAWAALSQAAASVAQALANMWPDTTQGLANTLEGRYFSIPAGPYNIIYQKVSGIAVEVSRTPNNTDVQALLALLPALTDLRNSVRVGGALEPVQIAGGNGYAGLLHDGRRVRVTGLGLDEDGPSLDGGAINPLSIGDTQGNVGAIHDGTVLRVTGLGIADEGPSFEAGGAMPIVVADRVTGRAGLIHDGQRVRAPGIGLGIDGPTMDLGVSSPLVVQAGVDGLQQLEPSGATSFAAVNTPAIFRYEGERKPFNRLADIVMVIHYGQSWPTGFENSAVSVDALYDCLMFNGTVRTQSVSTDPAVSMASFVPHVEVNQSGTPEFPGFPVGETPAAGFVTAVKELLYRENGYDPADANFQILSTAPGEGSKSIEDLADNSLPYMQRLKQQILRGYQLAQAAGKTFVVGVVSFTQSSSADGNNATYAAKLEAMRLDIENYAKDKVGDLQGTVPLISWQSFPYPNYDANAAVAPIYQRHVTTFDAYPNLICAGATYQLDQVSYNPDKTALSLHLTGASTKWLGALYGLVFKRVVLDKKGWKPIRPVSVKRQGVLVEVAFNLPDSRLVFDTERVTAAANMGFRLVRSVDEGSTPLPITSVAITGPNTVVIKSNMLIPSGARVIYGSGDIAFGRFAGCRGNLRDTQGLYIGEIAGTGFDLNNWAVVFDEPISN